MKRSWYLYFLLFTAVLFRAPTTSADDHLKFCFNSFEPFAYLEKNAAKGISVDIIREIGEIMGFEPEFLHLPWKRCLQLVREGHGTAVIDAAQRKEFLQGPTSASLFSNTVWVSADKPSISLDTLKPLENKTVGFVDGYDYPKEITSIPGLKVDLSRNDLIALRKLSAKRVDFVVADITNTYASRKRHELKIRPLSPTPSADRLYISFNKEKVAFQKKFDAVLKTLLESGVVDQIYRAHIDQSYGDILRSVEAVLND